MIPHNISEFLRAWSRGVEIYADPYALTSHDHDVTAGEQDRFDELTDEAHEIIDTSRMRLETRIASLTKAQLDYNKLENEFHNGLFDFAEDPRDDFETAWNKAKRSDALETAFSAACARWNFELRDAAKMGVAQADSRFTGTLTDSRPH